MSVRAFLVPHNKTFFLEFFPVFVFIQECSCVFVNDAVSVRSGQLSFDFPPIFRDALRVAIDHSRTTKILVQTNRGNRQSIATQHTRI